ncbi:MAG TPA: long-chain fatty acid--CoA ligase [Pyrinomonadaceae bacterium]|jgi:fatty-acyl-CoA synthase|nr:long-chain fatty acid--CoA ligase [Pyrinomonadaceae bacterium]
MFVRDWLARRAVLSRDKLAITDLQNGVELTYQQLDARATRLANYLRDRVGVESGDRISVLSTNRAGILEAFFAAAKLTAVLVPLNYRLTASELGYILEDCQPQTLLYERAFAEVVGDLRARGAVRHSIAFDGDSGAANVCYEDALAASSVKMIEVESFDPEMPVLIIYTSGTTGHPKGAVLSHRMLAWNSINTNLAWDIVKSDVTTVHAPLFHTGGFNVLTLPLLHIGASVVILPAFDAGRVLEIIERHRCTIFFGVPTMFQLMLESPRFATTDFSSVRYFLSGGAPCPVPLIEAYQRRGISFLQGYGLTEVGPNCFILGEEDSLRKAGSIGFPTFHSAARIVDAGGDVARGEIGELWLSGGHVCSGYWRNEEATQAALCDGWFHTGDLARQDEEGYYYIAGRVKDMIISGGENIYPAEVEAVLQEHPAIACAAMFGLPDAKWGEIAVAAIVKRQHVTSDEIIEFCATRLARYKLPKQVFFVEELPLSASGKVLKRTLREQAEQNLLPVASS